MQQQLVFARRGGKRKGAGRPSRRVRPGVAHSTRPDLKASFPVHVVLRANSEIGNLRRRAMYHAIRKATLCAKKRAGFRIVQLSIQRTHLHLLVEAENRLVLARGMQGFQISAAKHINAALGDGERRRGTVFPDRYHATIITSPKQARHAIAYILGNWRKPGEDRDIRLASWRIDWFSSAMNFHGWAEYDDDPSAFCGPPSYRPLDVSPAKTWLLRKGWARHGAISCFAVPRHEA